MRTFVFFLACSFSLAVITVIATAAIFFCYLNADDCLTVGQRAACGFLFGIGMIGYLA